MRNLRVKVNLNGNISLSHLTLRGYLDEALIRGLSRNRKWWVIFCDRKSLRRHKTSMSGRGMLEHSTWVPNTKVYNGRNLGVNLLVVGNVGYSIKLVSG